MDAEFWHERWQSNRIGFHQESVNYHLGRYWDNLGLAENSRVLVPLCGKSLDLIWLREQGHRVIGIEISPLAVSAFFAEHRMTPAVQEENRCTRHSYAGIELLCGDFFSLQAADIGPVDAFYDRAALIALPSAARHRYVAHLTRLTKPATPGLLVTLDYRQAEMDGPPFSVPPDEVRHLFDRHYAREHLQQADILDDNARFRDKGVQRLEEHVFALRRRK